MHGINYLKAVFWDYPEFQEGAVLSRVLKESRQKGDHDFLQWAMARFIEHGRVVDTLFYFTISEIDTNLINLRLSEYAGKKWKRLVEIYLNRQ